MTVEAAVRDEFPDATDEQVAAVVAAAQQQNQVWATEAQRVATLTALVADHQATCQQLATKMGLYQSTPEAVVAGVDQIIAQLDQVAAMPAATEVIVEVPPEDADAVAAAVVSAGFPEGTSAATVITALLAPRPAELVVPAYMRGDPDREVFWQQITAIRAAARLPPISEPLTLDQVWDRTLTEIAAAVTAAEMGGS